MTGLQLTNSRSCLMSSRLIPVGALSRRILPEFLTKKAILSHRTVPSLRKYEPSGSDVVRIIMAIAMLTAGSA